MIKSVLTSLQSRRASRPRWVTNGSMKGDSGLGDFGAWFRGGDHARSRRTSVKWPVTAAAAAIAGLTRWVRPPGPWRPSKLRLLVLAERWPGLSLSGFMAKHMLQPAWRHSAPAAKKI